MDINQTQIEADKLRAEAKQHWNRLLGLPDNTSSGSVDRIIDCIISCAILEKVIIESKAWQKMKEAAPAGSPFHVPCTQPNVEVTGDPL